MKYRVLGKTGWKVSVLGFGAAPLGKTHGDFDEKDGIRAVHAAIDLGVNFIDVAPYYGLTMAEAVLGKALKDISREKYYLATKVGRYGADEKDFDFSPERVVRSVDESLKRLRVAHIDLIQCQDIEFASVPRLVEETIPALQKLKRQGKVRHIGITGLPLKVFPPLSLALECGRREACEHEIPPSSTRTSNFGRNLRRRRPFINNPLPFGERPSDSGGRDFLRFSQ